MQAVLERIWKWGIGGQSRPLAPQRAVRACFFVNGALFATWASRIPAIKDERGLTNSELGFALLAIALGAVIAMPTAGYLVSRVGSGRMCKILSLTFCALLPAIAFVPSTPLFILTLLCFGAAHGAFDVAMNAQAVAVEKNSAMPIMSSFHAFWSIGGLAGASLGSVFAARGLASLEHFTVLGLLLAVAVLPAFPDLMEEGGALVARAEPTGLTSATTRFSWPNRTILALGTLALCVMIGEGAMADWSGVYLRNSLGADEGLAAAGYAAFSLAMAGGRLAGDTLTARWGAVFLARLSGILAAGGLALALVSGEVWLSLMGFVFVGAGFATVVPMVFSAAGRISSSAPGMGVASVSTLGYFGFLIGPPTIGFAADLVGLRTALILIVVTSGAVIFLASALKKAETQPRWR
jgi:MFS family permease